MTRKPTAAERRAYEELFAHVQPAKSRELLIGALEAFAARGFHAASTRDIAESAGLSPAGVYVHYRSKEDLLVELITVGHGSMLDAVRAAVDDGPDDPASTVRRYVEAWTEGHARRHTLARVSQYELASLPAERQKDIRRQRARLVALLEREVQRGVDAGVFAVDDVRTTVRAVMSLGIDVARWYGLERGPAPEAIGARYGDLALRMLDERREA